jgi:hypothetical protein
MNAGAVGVDRAELIKWYDARTQIGYILEHHYVKGLEMARECQHPDAVWLASLFPVGVTVTRERMRVVMLEQGDDPRAMWIAWRAGGLTGNDVGLLRRAADRGYARAQVDLAHHTRDDDESLRMLELATAQDDRDALYALGLRRMREEGEGSATAIELFRRAAELNDGLAQKKYGEIAFGPDDWQRYHWWGRAVSHGHYISQLEAAALRFLPSFEEGRNGRILHTLAPLLRGNIDSGQRKVFGLYRVADEVRQLERVIELHAAMLNRARRAIDCWSMAGRRLGVVKDMRVVIAKILWEEPWRWGEKEDARDVKKTRPS